MNVFDKTNEFARRNHFVDIEDKIPIFLCSVGGHIFNCLNKCSRCDFDRWWTRSMTSSLRTVH